MHNQSREDYLRAIYSIAEKTKNNNIKSIDIADFLNVSKAAVSKMLKNLQTQKLIIIQPYKTASLTKEGNKMAEKLTYKHRVIEVFLVDILKIAEKNIVSEAHKLEHAFSDKTIKKLAKFLNNPEVCPHGKKILKIKWDNGIIFSIISKK